MAPVRLTVAALFLLTLVGISLSAAPQIRLRSDIAGGRFVRVSKNMTVRANAGRMTRSSKFYFVPISVDHVTFQSVRYPGKYLIIRDGQLIASEPLPGETNHEFELLLLPDGQGTIALRMKDDCYIAFSERGRPIGPCGLQQKQPEVRLHIEVVA